MNSGMIVSVSMIGEADMRTRLYLRAMRPFPTLIAHSSGMVFEIDPAEASQFDLDLAMKWAKHAFLRSRCASVQVEEYPMAVKSYAAFLESNPGFGRADPPDSIDAEAISSPKAQSWSKKTSSRPTSGRDSS